MAGTIQERSLLAFSDWLAHLAFLGISRPSCVGMTPLTVTWALLYQLAVKAILPMAQSDLGNPLVETQVTLGCVVLTSVDN